MILKAAAIILVVVTITGLILFFYGPWQQANHIQPINFSHELHAGDFKIACLYCHANARRSPVAGIPSMQLCMGCHRNVGVEKSGVIMLNRAWNKRNSIHWVRVNDLPDFVYFTHKRHVKAGVVCQECHGAVETMKIIKATQPLTMERCVNCHQERQASIDCWTCHK